MHEKNNWKNSHAYDVMLLETGRSLDEGEVESEVKVI